MKTKAIVYWATTGILGFVLLSGGAAQLAGRPETVEGIVHLGYPLYFVTLLGIWKILGGLAVLAPRFPRLKEWAYAGIVFDLTGAAVSHAALGDGARHILVPLVFALCAVASWVLRPPSRTLGALSPAREPANRQGVPALSAL